MEDYRSQQDHASGGSTISPTTGSWSKVISTHFRFNFAIGSKSMRFQKVLFQVNAFKRSSFCQSCKFFPVFCFCLFNKIRYTTL